MNATDNQRIGDWMQTYTGVQFWPLDPHLEDIRIEDIAHSLSMQCRYAGHTKDFYSVAQHSVLVSQIVPPEDALWGLMHDAAEAYLVDLPRPLKRHNRMGELYCEIEDRLMVKICQRFHLPPTPPDSVKVADNIVLMTEKRDLMCKSPSQWRESAEPMVESIKWQYPWAAENCFLYRFKELGGV